MSLTARKVRCVPDAFGLQQMTALVACKDLESSPDCESKSWDERIPKANVVYVLAPSFEDELAARFVAGEKSIKNAKGYTRGGPDLGRSANTLARR